ncbi:MAG: hypothetical protein IJ072_08600 [Oscillospiraceae bacterium]|nr:hypothetical protein [Oscillospiraceae bacterium]
MKKLLAIILALVLVMALAACGGGKSDAQTTDDSAQNNSVEEKSDDTAVPEDGGQSDADATTEDSVASKPYPNANEDGTINLDKIAHYDRDYDYSQNEKYKIAYVASSSSFLYQGAADAIESWSPLFNLEWAGFIANNDGDSNTWMTFFQQTLDEGVEMFILDPDSTIYPAVIAKLEQYPDVKWMPMMGAARDGAEGDGVPLGGNLAHPYVGFNDQETGHRLTDRLYSWLQETYPDADPAQVGCIAFDYTLSPALHARAVACEDEWKAIAGESAGNFWYCDVTAAGLTYDGAKSVFPGEIAKHTDIKYWLIDGIMDDWALAAADTLEEAGLTDTSCCTTFGGTAFIQQWDGGIRNAARLALATAQTLYDEPILGAVYAFKMGWCTEEEIWPSWVKPDDHGAEGHSYSTLLLPTLWLSPDDYLPFLKWSDMYGNTDIYSYLKGYDETEVAYDAYSPFVTEFPDYYTGPLS